MRPAVGFPVGQQQRPAARPTLTAGPSESLCFTEQVTARTCPAGLLLRGCRRAAKHWLLLGSQLVFLLGHHAAHVAAAAAAVQQAEAVAEQQHTQAGAGETPRLNTGRDRQ